MTVTYEKVADSRPRIRRDVLFTRTPGGVVFHNAHGGFNLGGAGAYRFASLIVPHLNGENRVSAICAGLGDKQRAMVAELVSTLYARGFARDVPEGDDGLEAVDKAVRERFAAQLGYIDHYTGQSGPRFARFRDARVAVLGRDETAAWCVLSLVRNGASAVSVPAGEPSPVLERAVAEAAELTGEGCPVAVGELPAGAPGSGWAALDGFDVVVAAGGPAQLLALVSQGVPDGVALLPVWRFGNAAVVGPLTARGTAGCWSCAALRMGGNAEGEAAALWSAAALGEDAPAGGAAVAGPQAAMLGNLAGYEVFRLRTGALPAESAGKVVVQDLESLDVVSETLLPHPRCPFCRPAAAAPEPVELGAEPLPARPDGLPDDGDATLAELTERGVLVAARAGVFCGWADEDREQTPLKSGTVVLGSGAGRREVTAFDVHHVAGARLRALRVAAGLYAGREQPRPDAAAGPAVDPAALDVWAGTGGAPGPVPRVAAVSLLSGAPAGVPAGAVAPFSGFNAAGAFTATPAGTGAGGTLAQAAARGLLSALAYRALTGALRGGEVLRVAASALEGDAELLFLLRSARTLGLELELLDLVAPGRPAPVLLARAREAGEGAWHWAVGAAVSWAGAAASAMRDVLGAAQAGGAVDAGDPLLADLAPQAVAVTGDGGFGADAAGGWPGVLERLAADGSDALVSVLGGADLAAGGLRVVRVLLVNGTDRAE